MRNDGTLTPEEAKALALFRINNRSWVLSVFSILRLWWVALGPIILKLLEKYNFECNIDLWKHSLKLTMGQEFSFEVYVKGDDEKRHLFYIRVWRTRFFVRAEPVWQKPNAPLPL